MTGFWPSGTLPQEKKEHIEEPRIGENGQRHKNSNHISSDENRRCITHKFHHVSHGKYDQERWDSLAHGLKTWWVVTFLILSFHSMFTLNNSCIHPILFKFSHSQHVWFHSYIHLICITIKKTHHNHALSSLLE
jgi:hypothetical protein